MPTFLALKKDALRGYRLRQMVEGSTNTNGTTTVLNDTIRQEPAGEWDRIDAFVRFTDGTNIGLERRVTGWSTNSALTFAPAVTASVASGVGYYVSKTFLDVEVGLAVNEALRDAFPERIVRSIATTAEAYVDPTTGDGRAVSVPSGAASGTVRLVRVERSVGTTNSSWDWATLVEGVDYRMVWNGDTATLIQTGYTGASGHILRFFYERPATELVADTDSTTEPASVILSGARKWLAIQEGDGPLVERFGREFEQAKHDYVKSRGSQKLRTPVIRAGW